VVEGIVSKRKDSPYRSGRSPDWRKMKNPDRADGEARNREGLGTGARDIKSPAYKDGAKFGKHVAIMMSARPCLCPPWLC
jgi:hypothetical protein